MVYAIDKKRKLSIKVINWIDETFPEFALVEEVAVDNYGSFQVNECKVVTRQRLLDRNLIKLDKKKYIIVTENNINEFNPYQGTCKKLEVGDILHIVGGKIPCVWERKDRSPWFYQVTDWTPIPNSLYLIARVTEPDAEKYGWQSTANIIKHSLEEKKEIIYFNRWSINEMYLTNPLKHRQKSKPL